MCARTPRPIWTNAVGQRKGLIVRGCPHQIGHVLCHHIIIYMGIDDDMIDVILNNQQNSGRLTLAFHGQPDFCCRNQCRYKCHSHIVWWIIVCLYRRGRPQPSSSSSASSISLPPPWPLYCRAFLFLLHPFSGILFCVATSIATSVTTSVATTVSISLLIPPPYSVWLLCTVGHRHCSSLSLFQLLLLFDGAAAVVSVLPQPSSTSSLMPPLPPTLTNVFLF